MDESRKKLILEAFELSREIGYQKFLADNFDRPDPALLKLNPGERTAFLREWWDGARDRMYEDYRELVAGLSLSRLLELRQDYIEVLDGLGIKQWQQDQYEQVLKEAAGKGEPSLDVSRDKDREL
jgi:hypothetical protein